MNFAFFLILYLLFHFSSLFDQLLVDFVCDQVRVLIHFRILVLKLVHEHEGDALIYCPSTELITKSSLRYFLEIVKLYDANAHRAASCLEHYAVLHLWPLRLSPAQGVPPIGTGHRNRLYDESWHVETCFTARIHILLLLLMIEIRFH